MSCAGRWAAWARSTTLLIGAGYGNLTEAEAVEAWIQGIKHALSGTVEGDDRKQRITFIEADGAKIRRIQDAILEAKRRLKEQKRLEIEYRRLSRDELEAIGTKNLVADRARPQSADPTHPDQLRLRVRQLPVRRHHPGRLHPRTGDPPRRQAGRPGQRRTGREWNPPCSWAGTVPGAAVDPRELRDQLSTRTPIVLSLDATTARIHWELVAQPQFSDVDGPDGPVAPEPGRDFLGTSRGLTRQLRTTFAPRPSPRRRPAGCCGCWWWPTRPKTRPAAPRRRGRGRRPVRGLQSGLRVGGGEQGAGDGAAGPARGHPHQRAPPPHAALLRRAPLRRPRHLQPRHQVLRLALQRRRAGHRERAEPHRPHPQVRVLQRLPVRHHPRPVRATLGRPGAELRRVVLRPWRVQLRLHRLARRGRGRADVRPDPVPAAAGPVAGVWRIRPIRQGQAAADARRDAASTPVAERPFNGSRTWGPTSTMATPSSGCSSRRC